MQHFIKNVSSIEICLYPLEQKLQRIYSCQFLNSCQYSCVCFHVCKAIYKWDASSSMDTLNIFCQFYYEYFDSDSLGIKISYNCELQLQIPHVINLSNAACDMTKCTSTLPYHIILFKTLVLYQRKYVEPVLNEKYPDVQSYKRFPTLQVSRPLMVYITLMVDDRR